MARQMLAPGAGYPALPGSAVAIERVLPSEYLIEPKVSDCPRHRHYATGGLGYSEPYSCWTPLGNGCTICDDQKPENRKKVIQKRIAELEKELAEMKPALVALQKKYGIFKSFTVVEFFKMEKIMYSGQPLGDLQKDYELAELEMKIKMSERAIEEYMEELKDEP